MIIEVPVSIGELIDKMTILMIKKKKSSDQQKLKHIGTELEFLETKLSSLELVDKVGILKDQLYEINLKLWQIEDDIRECEAAQIICFDNPDTT